jgi:isocitrate dehydrogenase
MFEAIHGSAPDISGMGIANPSGLLNGAIMMLVHIGMPEMAEKIANAWMRTLEDGIHTGDIYQEGLSTKKAGTQEFAQAVIERLGQKPIKMIPVEYDKEDTKPMVIKLKPQVKQKKELIGVDVFIDWDEDNRNFNVIGERLRKANANGLQLQLITNRGVKVFPEGMRETFCTDHWRCRFKTADQGVITHDTILELLKQIQGLGFDFIKTEHLYTFDGVRGYSLAQGE